MSPNLKICPSQGVPLCRCSTPLQVQGFLPCFLIRRPGLPLSPVFRLQRDGAPAGNLKPVVKGQKRHATHPTESDSGEGRASSHVGSSLCDFVARSPRRDVGGRFSRVSETAITSQSPRSSGNPPGCLQQHIRRETLPNDDLTFDERG